MGDVDFPRYRGQRVASQRGTFKCLRADAAEMAVATNAIVEGLDVIEDVSAGEVAGFVDPLAHALFLWAAEEGFGDRIVPAAAASTHAGLEVVRATETYPIVATVLGALVGVNDDALLWLTPPHCHQERPYSAPGNLTPEDYANRNRVGTPESTKLRVSVVEK
jgi:hypothetical protein